MVYLKFNKKVGRVKKNNYSLSKDVLSIKTECGEYKFKIDGDTGLTNAQRIAETMVNEMEKVEKQFQTGREKSSPYAKLLLSNLNISDRYIQLETKYNQLRHEHERVTALYRSRDKSPGSMDQRLKSVTPFLETKTEGNPPSPRRETETEPKTEAPEPVKTQEPVRPGPLVRQVLETLKKAQNTTVPKENPDPQAPPQPGALQETPEPTGPPEPKTRQDAETKTEQVPEPEPQADPCPRLKINSAESNRNRPRISDTPCSDEFQLPHLRFLKSEDQQIEVDQEAIRRDAELLEQKLGYFGIKGEVMEISPGPVITTFEYKPAPGIKISKIVNLADDLALALSALSIRIVAPIPGKDVIGVEIPNEKMSIVPFLDIVGSDEFSNIDSRTPICLGKDIIGNPIVVGLDKMPHLLIAGATGTGKSVALNAMITSILYKSSPHDVKFIMIDPKRIELSLFNDIPHLLAPVITEMKKANTALQWVVREMERRYEKLARLQVRNIEQYNHKIKNADLSEYEEDEEFEHFSYIVIIIDELADLMMTASKDIEFSLTRIAQMARAAGIHLILATQRPSVDVLTGIIKANFPTRISFQVSSKTDSRTIIDANGAETLLGRGDMLFVPPGTARLARVHGTFLSEEELTTITDFLKAQGKPRYVLDVITEREGDPAVEVSQDDYDEKYQAALDFVLATGQASISSVQRALRVGYNRAARIIDLMEKKGIVGSSDGIKPRQVLVGRME